jgi:hypothetical protein
VVAPLVSMIAVLPLLYRFIYVDAIDFTTRLRFEMGKVPKRIR